MNRKVLYLGLCYIAFIFFGMASCADCDDDAPTLFRAVSMVATPGFNLSGVVRTSDSIPSRDFAIDLNFDLEFYGQNSSIPTFNIIQSAYACDDPIPTSGAILDNIIISSLTSFNADYPSGSNLAELFDVIVDPEDTFNERLDLTEYLATNPPGPERLILLLKEQPAETASFRFNIEYFQTGVDENFFSFTTNPVVLKRL